MMDGMTLLGCAACIPEGAERCPLPFDCAGIDRGAIPVALRRRTSLATQLAFSAASLACRNAGRSPSGLPSVFATVGGEIRVTDTLCLELAKPDGVISPTAFHNSVHNTAAAYWGIAHGCTQAASALAAGRDTFAMALLEVWCSLETLGGVILLVCYDEDWPEYLAAPMGSSAFAAAMVLAAGRCGEGIAWIGRPRIGPARDLPESLVEWIAQVPAAMAVPLLSAVATGQGAEAVPLSAATPGWVTEVQPLAEAARAQARSR